MVDIALDKILRIDKDGLTRLRFDEIKEYIDKTVIKEVAHPLNTAADSVVGQYNGSIAEIITQIVDAVEDVYSSQYPGSATGVSLDGAVSYIGIERGKPTYTMVLAVCYGENAKTIPKGSISETTNKKIYESQLDTIISLTSVVDAYFSVEVLADTLYQITMGSNIISYTSDSDPTESEILTGLAAVISDEVNSAVEGDKLRATSKDGVTGRVLTKTSNITINEFGSAVLFIAKDIGRNPLPPNALINVVSSVDGWDRIDNLGTAVEGTNKEEDDELYQRQKESGKSIGGGTLGAIKSRLVNDISGVTSAEIYENRESIIVNGLPPFSLECVVDGGSDGEVATKFYNELKGGGVNFSGNTDVSIVDINGDSLIVPISRPVKKYAWLNIVVTEYDEEILPEGYQASLKTSCAETGNNFGVSVDIIIQRFLGPCYDSTPGISKLDITVAITDTEGGTPAFGPDNIQIGRSENSVFDISRITVLDI